MSEKQVRLALIGCGGIAKYHLLYGYQPLIEKGVDTFSIDATCDIRKEAAEDYADRVAAFQGAKPRAYDNIEEMLKVENLNGADICTPHSHHHSSAIPCLGSGVDVMTEKPFGITIKASKKMIEVAEKNGRLTATAEQCRRELGQRTVRWALNEGNIVGAPRMFFAQTADWRDPSERISNWRVRDWRLEKEFSGGGMALDTGAHMMDTIRYFFGEVEKVYAQVRQIEERFVNHPERGRFAPTVRIRGLLLSPLRAALSGRGVLQTPRLFTNSSTLRSTAAKVSFGTTGVSFTRLLETMGM